MGGAEQKKILGASFSLASHQRPLDIPIPPGPLLRYLRNPANLARPLSETIAREENERRYRSKCLTSRVNACRFVYLSSDP